MNMACAETRSDAFTVFPELHTTRLKLRQIEPGDAGAILSLLGKPEVLRYDTFERFTSLQQADELIAWFSQAYLQKKAIFWGLTLHGRTELIGFCKCEIEVPGVRADLGFDLQPEYWNQGVMSEALSAIVAFAFARLDVNRIEAAAATANKASIRVLEKTGLTQEGILRQRSWLDGVCHDMAMLAILRVDWANGRG